MGVPEAAAPPSLPPATPSMPSPTGFSNHGIHLVRTAMQMNLALSQMADQKASILMGATFVVFTIAVGQIRSGGLPVSLTVLALFAFVSALCAVFAVLPSVGPAKGAEANKLFFGHYAATPEAEWIDSVLADLPRDEAVFRLMLRDIHQNGSVLQRKKYRYLRLAYQVFIVGLCLTVVTFVCETLGLVSASTFLAD
jgi:hypothetical protein